MFVCGPGFPMVQIFVETIFEKHVDWISLIRNDDNFKNILQVKIQKEFKVTPDYLEVQEYDSENGYHMGVYLCLGQSVHNLKHNDAIQIPIFILILKYINICQNKEKHSYLWGKEFTK